MTAARSTRSRSSRPEGPGTSTAGRVFALPDLGEGLTEAEITEWLVRDGDTVTIDQHVVVVETAKASVEVPCPYAGRVLARHGQEGDVVEVGQPLITIDGAGSAGTPGQGSTGDETQAEPGDPQEDSGAVLVGYGTSGDAGNRRRRRARPSASADGTAPAAPAVPAPPAPAPAAPTPPSRTVTNGAAPKVISPIVRQLAKTHGLDLRSIAPGADGIIRRQHVEAAVGGAAAAASSAPATSGDTRVPMTGLRRAVAEKLTRSRREIPDASTWVDVDATELLSAREALRDPQQDVSLLGLLARICVAGLQRYPELNVSVDGDAIVTHASIGIGFAAQSPRGLVVPVVRGAERMSTRELSAALRELTAKAREGTLAPAELTGGTFTLNNYGVFGVDGSTPIINHPEAAMLGVGRIIDKPWVLGGELTVRKVTQLSFTFDHRVCDGGTAGGFLRYVADCVERPIRMLADR